jgi:hypothetical protein
MGLAHRISITALDTLLTVYEWRLAHRFGDELTLDRECAHICYTLAFKYTIEGDEINARRYSAEGASYRVRADDVLKRRHS